MLCQMRQYFDVLIKYFTIFRISILRFKIYYLKLHCFYFL